MDLTANLSHAFSLLANYDNLTYDEFHDAIASHTRYTIVKNAQTVLVPVIFLFGLLGNLLALGCFLSQSLRGTSCCLYMAAKCVSDTVFLAALFLMWLHRVHVEVVNVQGVCQLTVFFSYVSGFSSVWLVLAITYENYVRMCHPHLVNARCTRTVALIVIGVVVGVSVVIYSFALWTNTIVGGDGGGGDADEVQAPLCMAMSKFKDVLMAMTFVDTVMTLVLPSLLIIPLVLATLAGVVRALDRKTRLKESLLAKGQHTFMNSMEVKVARFLLTVSLTFLLLHTPGHLIRLKLLVERYILHKELTTLDATLQRTFETLYYFNFCCSIVIFLASGANFRALFVSMYCHRRIVTMPAASTSSSAATATATVVERRRRMVVDDVTETTFVENGVFRKDSGHP